MEEVRNEERGKGYTKRKGHREVIVSEVINRMPEGKAIEERGEYWTGE